MSILELSGRMDHGCAPSPLTADPTPGGLWWREYVYVADQTVQLCVSRSTFVTVRARGGEPVKVAVSSAGVRL